MIDIERLKEKDIGRWVIYKGTGEEGRIKSWNDNFVYVVYHCDNDWNDFKNYTGQCTDPLDLNFKKKRG